MVGGEIDVNPGSRASARVLGGTFTCSPGLYAVSPAAVAPRVDDERLTATTVPLLRGLDSDSCRVAPDVPIKAVAAPPGASSLP